MHWIGDITAASTVYYTNDQTVHADSGPWAANSLYDFFDDGTALCHQNWTARSSSGAVPPPVAVTCSGQYVGTGSTDANGQFNQQKTAGPARRWDIWNYFNQYPIDLQVVDGAVNQQITVAQTSWTPITSNSYAVFVVGLPQEANCLILQQVYPYTQPGGVGNASWGTVACGWGAQFANPVAWTWPVMTGQPQGTWGQQGADSWISNQNAGAGEIAPGGTAIADYGAVDAVGVQTVYSVAIVEAISGGSWVKLMGKNPPVERIMHIRFRG